MNVAIHVICVPIIFFTGLILSHKFSHSSWLSLPLPLINSTFDLNFISATALAYAAYFVLLEPIAGVSPFGHEAACGGGRGHMTRC